jgi:hypothetical protein
MCVAGFRLNVCGRFFCRAGIKAGDYKGVARYYLSRVQEIVAAQGMRSVAWNEVPTPIKLSNERALEWGNQMSAPQNGATTQWFESQRYHDT